MSKNEPINILVIDDKKVIHDFFDITLGYYGHRITVLQDTASVREIIKEKILDIVFLDMVMPEKSGIEVLKDIRGLSPELPVIMMSGYSIQEKKDEAIRLGARGCLKKPFEVEDIRKIIKQVINRDL
jgi:DNA-binding NtrC family response regulator